MKRRSDRNEAKSRTLANDVRYFLQVPMGRVALVVDDEPLVLMLIADMLDDLGCDVVCAHNGTEALAMLAGDQRIEILITDINMPGLAGYDLAEKAKGMRHNLNPILLSGRESDSHGFPMIRKPFLQDDLRRIMKETCGLC